MAGQKLETESLQLKLYYKYTPLLIIFLIFSIHIFLDPRDPIICQPVPYPVDESSINDCYKFGLYRSTSDVKLTHKIDIDNLIRLPGIYDHSIMLLLIQAAIFYLSRYIWTYLENGTLRQLLNEMNECTDVDDPRIKCAAEEFFAKHRQGQLNSYFRKFVFCEFLNCINNITQAIVISYFLDFNFFTYGIKYLQNDNRNRYNNVDFPFEAYCKIPGKGQVSRIDGTSWIAGICLIAINAINAIVYLVLWFWLGFIGIISLGNLFWRFFSTFGPSCIKMYSFESSIQARNDYDYKPLYKIPINWKIFEKCCKVGDIFVLSQISKNISGYKSYSVYLAFLFQVNDFLQHEYGRFEEFGISAPPSYSSLFYDSLID